MAGFVPGIETFEKCSILFKAKEGENFNHSKTSYAHSFIDGVPRGLHYLVGYWCKRTERNGALGAERVLVAWGLYFSVLCMAHLARKSIL